MNGRSSVDVADASYKYCTNVDFRSIRAGLLYRSQSVFVRRPSEFNQLLGKCGIFAKEIVPERMHRRDMSRPKAIKKCVCSSRLYGMASYLVSMLPTNPKALIHVFLWCFEWDCPITKSPTCSRARAFVLKNAEINPLTKCKLTTILRIDTDSRCK